MCTGPAASEASGDDGGGAEVGASPAQRFFAGRCVLVTGATGFVGKALVEKLLRATDVSTVFALVRPKRGMDAEQRLKELKDSTVFERVRRERPSALRRLVAVRGDVGVDALGLSAADRRHLSACVSLVFHAAATVRFNEPLRVALNLNAEGARRVVELCRDLERLEALVHVSTAYANADRERVDECVYPPPAEPRRLVDACDALDDASLEVLWTRVRGRHPNTYTLTKALAEWTVAEAADLPSAIVRPSIVTAAWREPEPGWVDNVSGVTGIMTEIGRGTIRSIICDERLVMDLIPVDVVANTLLAAAFRVAHDRGGGGGGGGGRPLVVNCTSGERNPVLWKDFGRLTQKHALQLPSRFVMWYPGFRFRTNRVLHAVCAALFHFAPALLVDLVLRARGDKPIMLKIAQRFARACATGEFFALHQWAFASKNICDLLRDERDRLLFCTDVAPMCWDTYVHSYMLGIRRFVLKDAPDTLPGAKRKLRALYWVHRFAQAATVVALLKFSSALR